MNLYSGKPETAAPIHAVAYLLYSVELNRHPQSNTPKRLNLDEGDGGPGKEIERMNKHFSYGIRMLAVLIVVALALSAIPMLFKTPLATNAAAAAATGGEVKVGWMSSIAYWNPMNIEMVEDYVASYLLYSCLWMYDENANTSVNDLVTGYIQTINPNGSMTTVIDITSHAFFRTLANINDISNPLTAYDVKGTLDRIRAVPGGTWDTYLYNITNIKVNSNTQLEILTDFPKATLHDDLNGIPIVDETMWRDYSDNAFISRGMKPSACLGSGPFVYNASANTYYRFTAAPNYHGATDYGAERTIKIHNILYTVFGDPQALTLAMNSGEVDTIVLTGQPNLYLNTLGKDASVNVIKQTVQEMGICDIAINGIPELKNGNLQQWRERNYATGNGLLQDVMVRKALAMTLNKQSIKDDIYKGLVRIADSVVQPGYWHKTPDNQVSYDPAAAKLMLEALGYQDTDTDGTLEATSGSRAVVEGWASVGDELSFRLHAPTNEPSYMAIAQNWVQWAELAGIKLNYRALSESFMTNADWFMSDYDIWVWHWGWSPEPLGAILSTWMTDQMKVGGDNCQGPMGPWWYGPDNETASPTGTQYSSFDQTWTNALRTIDTAARKVLVDRLQQQVYDSYSEIPPFYDVGLYAYTDERFMGWGDWETHIGRSTYATYLWLWYDLEPLGNARPVFDSPLNPSYTVLVNTPQTFQVVVYDAELTDTVTVNWSFGDGSPIERVTVGTGVTTPTTVSRTHTYAVLSPVYGYNLSAALWDGQPGHEKLSKAVVYVVSSPDTGPSIGAVSAVPASPQYNDTVITWSVSARDHESGGPGAKNYGLLFTWNWGDGTYTVTRYHPTVDDVNVIDTHTHSWSSMGVYNVRVNVWDGFGLQTDPVHNASSGVISYEIIENTPPDTPTISPISGTAGTWVTCLASSADLDPDTLRFTWDWGGTYNVTNHAVSVPLGSQVTSTVMHNWATAGTYPVTVYVDDLSGLAGHNRSSSVDAVITPGAVNVAPTALLLSATPSTAYNDAVVTLDASAIDTDGDPLSFYITYGDGGTGVASTAGGSAAKQYVTPAFTHSYATASVYTVTIHVNDGQGHNVSTTTTVTIIENSMPDVPTISPISGTAGTWVTCLASSADLDPDTLRFTWDWGGTYNVTNHAVSVPLGSQVTSTVMHNWATAGTYPVTVYVDDLSGLAGHNRSSSVDAVITPGAVNVAPTALLLSATPSTAYNDAVVTLDASAIDTDGDPLSFYITYGDGGTGVASTAGGSAAKQYVTPAFTHSYATASVYTVTIHVNDGQGHNVSTTTTVTIIENQPPTLTIQTTLSARYNATFSMEPTQVADTDGDTVTVWYDWGDDSAMTAGDPLNAYAASHVYHVTGVLTVTVWADDGTGLAGHNVSQSADITISQNLIPQFRGAVTKTPSKVAYNQSESITFAFTVWDYEGDNLTLVIQWGDGAVTTETHKPAADTNYTWNVSHAYAVGNTDPYVLNATLKDDMDHYQQTWQIAHSNVQVNKPSAPTEPKGGTNWALIGGIGAIIIVALVIIAVLLMKRKKGGEKAEETAGGMEGMAPPPP